MQDPAFIAHKAYLNDIARAARPAKLHDYEKASAQHGRGAVKAKALVAVGFVLGLVQPWIA